MDLSAQVFHPNEPERIRASFLALGNALPPQIDDAGVRQALILRLDHEIARNRLGLVAHAQRILLYAESGNGSGIFAALLDLYIALGAKGRDLRSTLLNRARALLTPEQAAFLEERLGAGIGELEIVPDAPGSQLSRGLCGHVDLVRRTEERAAAEAGPVTIAERFLCDGHVDQAIELLESLVRQSPPDARAAAMLLDVYRRARSDQRFFAILPALSAATDEVREPWESHASMLRTLEGGAR